MTRVDPDERDATISACIENYKSGEFGPNRARAVLAACGLNASETDELLAPHRAEASRNFITYKGRSR